MGHGCKFFGYSILMLYFTSPWLLCNYLFVLLSLFLRFLKFIFRKRGREAEREGGKHHCVVASRTTFTGDLACNPGMCPDWESNLWPFSLQASTQSTESNQPGPICTSFFFKVYFIDYDITVVPFFFSPFPSSLHSPLPCSTSLPLSSSPWVIHRSSLASPFPTLFLTSPCLFCAYLLCFLFPVSFPPILPILLPTDSHPRDLHFCDSVPVLIVCLVLFLFFRLSCW